MNKIILLFPSLHAKNEEDYSQVSALVVQCQHFQIEKAWVISYRILVFFFSPYDISIT